MMPSACTSDRPESWWRTSGWTESGGPGFLGQKMGYKKLTKFSCYNKLWYFVIDVICWYMMFFFWRSTFFEETEMTRKFFMLLWFLLIHTTCLVRIMKQCFLVPIQSMVQSQSLHMFQGQLTVTVQLFAAWLGAYGAGCSWCLTSL